MENNIEVIEKEAQDELEKTESVALEQIEKDRELEQFAPPTLAPKSLAEQAKDFVAVEATKKAIQDDKLVSDIAQKKKNELMFNAAANLKKEEAESKSADIKLQEANFGVYSGVANYAGIKRALPKKMQTVLFTFLAIIQTIFLIIFGVPTSILTIIADCIDVNVQKLSNVTKSARWCVVGIVVAMIVGSLALFLFHILKKYGIIDFI